MIEQDWEFSLHTDRSGHAIPARPDRWERLLKRSKRQDANGLL